jgi:formate hydrogenlyase subunit 3/multisubunit Na+/H+ antiporter MnhD subunit
LSDYAATLPIAVPLLGAVVLLLADRWLTPLYRHILAIATAAVTTIAALLLAATPALSEAEGPIPTVRFTWFPHDVLSADLVLRADVLAMPFVLFLAITTLGITVMADHETSPRVYAATFALLAAAATCTLAANLLTFAFAWVALDLAMLAIISTGISIPAAGRAMSLSTLVGPLLLAAATLVATSGGDLTFDHGPWPELAVSLTLVAALVRLGLYPAHRWLPTDDALDPLAIGLLRLAPPGVGACLLLRLANLTQAGTTHALSFLGCIALLATALLAWGETRWENSVSFVALNQAAFVAAAIGIGGTTGAIAALGGWIGMVLGVPLLAVSRHLLRADASPGERLAARTVQVLAVASLLGVPLLPGFTGRWALYRAAVENGQLLVLAVAVIACSFVLAALFKGLRAPTKDKPASRWTWAGAIVLLVPFVLVGLQGAMNGSMNVSPLLGVLLLPAVGACVIEFARSTRRLAMPGAGQRLIGLAWLYDLTARLVGTIAMCIGRAARSPEGESFPAWLVFFVILAIVLVLGV